MCRKFRWQLVLVIAALCGVEPALAGGKPDAGTGMPTDVRGFRLLTGHESESTDKTELCEACHGSDGNAIIPGYPSLAGQPSDYLYLQLMSFASGWRENAIMQAQVTAISDQDMRALAVHFSHFPRHAGATAEPAPAERGAVLYAAGDPAAGVPPCQGCHGPQASGLARPITGPASQARNLPRNFQTYPVLAGLSAGYVSDQLTAYQQGIRGGTTNARIMQGVARQLDVDAIKALAAYLETLPGN